MNGTPPVPVPGGQQPGLPVSKEGSTPGIGMAGTMICPFFKAPCFKNGCMMWVELTYAGGTKDERRVGHCTFSWQTVVQTEQTDQIKRLIDVLSKFIPQEQEAGKP